MTQFNKVTVTTSISTKEDAALNDSDKRFFVPVGSRWHLFAIQVANTSTATVGNRQMRVDFLDSTIINGQDETSYNNSPTTEGVFSGGTGHAGSDVITLSDGTTVTVDNVAAGVVDQFTIDSTGSTKSVAGDQTLSQSSTDGSGVGFTLSPGIANIGRVVCSVVAGAVQAASLTYTYSFAPGMPHLTSVIGTALMTPMPATMVLESGYSIRVYDSTAVAAAADDMTVRLLYDDNSLKYATP